LGSDDEETEADVEATKQGDVVVRPLESVLEKRRCPNRVDSDTPWVEVEDDELKDIEDDDGKTLVSDTYETESEILEASGDGKEDEEFETDSAVDEDENGSAPDEEQGKIKSSNLTLVNSDPSNIACNCESDYLITDGICSVDVDLEPGSANTEFKTG
ncbi:hypothetical protein U1Q18_027819, partial [Sarracenia purpurea var. burkii]